MARRVLIHASGSIASAASESAVAFVTALFYVIGARLESRRTS
jgi:hypothetical protein